MALSEEDKSEVTGLINSTINGAIATLRKNGEQQRAKDNDALKGDIAKLMDEKFSKFTPPAGSEEEPPDGKGGKGGKNEKYERELSSMRRQIEDLAKTAKDNADIARAEREKNRTNSLKASVREALEPMGITGARFTGAYATLMMTGRVRYAADDSDDLVFVDESGEMDYRQGLSTWAKGDEAKIYLPPTGAAGSGSRPTGSRPVVKSGPVTTEERKSKMDEVLGNWAETR